jgi:siroheme synthase
VALAALACGGDDMGIALIEVLHGDGCAARDLVSGSLETLPHLAKAARMEAPALIVVGEVVRLRRDLEWFVPQLQSSAEVVPMARTRS